MATIFGSCPSLSSRLCHLTARCIHTHVKKEFKNPPSLLQWKRAIHSITNRIVAEQTVKPEMLGRPGSFKICRNHGENSKKYAGALSFLRQGNNVMYMRFMSSSGGNTNASKLDGLYYGLSLFIMFIGLGYAGVPLFKMFCRQFGLGGDPTLSIGHDRSKIATMKKVEDRELIVNFKAEKNCAMQWNFRPQQSKMKVHLGETALAFFSAENPTDRPIVGIATYTVTPYVAAPYFNKIQCFCFEEQILNPHEKVDMPVFFYIDPDYDDDFELEFEDNITLAYTFFEAKDNLNLPLPGFAKPQEQTPQTA